MAYKKTLQYLAACSLSSLMFASSLSQAQISPITELIVQAGKSGEKVDLVYNACAHKGYQIQTKNEEHLDIERGVGERAATRQLASLGFRDKRDIMSSSGPFARTMRCGDSSFSIVNYCKMVADDDTFKIQVVKANFKEFRLGDKCVHGLSNRLEIKVYEPASVTQTRPLFANAMTHLELTEGMSAVAVERHMMQIGWTIWKADKRISERQNPCLNRSDGKTITQTRYYQKITDGTPAVIQSVRIEFVGSCVGGEKVTAGVLNKVILTPT